MKAQRPLRVGLLVKGNEEYGVGTFLRNLVQYIDREKIQIFGLLLVPPTENRYLAPMLDGVYELGQGRINYTHEILAGTFPVGPLSQIRKLVWISRATMRAIEGIRRLRLAVIHAHAYPTNLVAGLASRLTSTKCIWHCHGSFRRSAFRGTLLRFGAQYLADHIVCVSNFVAKTLPPVVQGKVTVIYNGLDTATMRQNLLRGALRQRFGIPVHVPLVALIGRIAPSKGHEDFVRAAAEITHQMPEVRFVVIGDTTGVNHGERFLQRLRELGTELGLGDRLIFTGKLPHAARYLADCTLVCMPSHPSGEGCGEGLGLVLLEAMAVGVPVIATECGGPTEVIEHGVNGLLVPPQDSHALAGAMRDLLSSESRRQVLSSTAQQLVERRFSVNQMVKTIEMIYQQVAQQNRLSNCGQIAMSHFTGLEEKSSQGNCQHLCTSSLPCRL